MNDPKHLTDEGSEATDFERGLLESAQGLRMSQREKQAVWAAVALAAAPTAVLGTAAASTATSTKTALGLSPLLKGALVALGVGSASLGGYWLTRSPGPNAPPQPARWATAPASAVPAMALPSPVEAAPVETVPPEAVPVGPPPNAASTPSAKDVKSALRDESASVLEIRRTLRGGDASSALRLLESARSRFPRGALSQEREALAIEALAKSGAKTSASRRAQRFLQNHPSSPYAADVQSFVSP